MFLYRSSIWHDGCTTCPYPRVTRVILPAITQDTPWDLQLPDEAKKTIEKPCWLMSSSLWEIEPDLTVNDLIETKRKLSIAETTMSSCENCKFRAKYDQNPKSFLGRLWRWHIGFCPGWKKYYKSLPEEKKNEIAQKYELKTK